MMPDLPAITLGALGLLLLGLGVALHAWRLVGGHRINALLRETEQRSRESEARYRLLAENSTDVIFRSRVDGARLYVSPSVRQLQGFEPAEMIGLPAFTLVHPEDVEDVVAALRMLTPNGPSTVLSYRVKHKDGSYRWIEFAARQITGPDGSMEIVGGMRDISIRKAAEDRLKYEQERFRDFALASSDWFWEQDAEFRFTFVSQSAGSFGHDSAVFLGKTRWDLEWQDVSDAEWEAHRADLLAQRPFRDLRLKRLGHDGSIHHVSISGRPVFDDADVFRGYRGTARDITLEVEAAHALERAKITAEQASRAKSEFLSNMSHELRTPLNAIIGFSELIEGAVFAPIDAKYREYAGDIGRSGRHLLALINDVLDLSKIEAGRLELHEEEVSVNDLVQSSAHLVAEQGRSGGISFLVTIPPETPLLRADALRLKQVLLNLLSNAVKFTEAGGSVSIAAEQTSAGMLAIKVVDTGIGMAEADIPKALEPFRQVDGSLARRYEGTGLGLSLAKKLVELHGGTLSIASRLGHGTEVTIEMPSHRVRRQAA